MKKSEMKDLIEEARQTFSNLISEDLEYRKALVSGKFDTNELKAKHQSILDLMKRMENLKN